MKFNEKEIDVLYDAICHWQCRVPFIKEVNEEYKNKLDNLVWELSSHIEKRERQKREIVKVLYEEGYGVYEELERIVENYLNNYIERGLTNILNNKTNQDHLSLLRRLIVNKMKYKGDLK